MVVILVYKQQQEILTGLQHRRDQPSPQQFWCRNCTVVQCVVFCHNILCWITTCAIGGRFQGPQQWAPPREIPVPLLSQCQSHWLTWILSLLCSTASSWYMATNIQYVLHQLMFSLQSDCLYFIPSGKEKGAGKLYWHAIVVVWKMMFH